MQAEAIAHLPTLPKQMLPVSLASLRRSVFALLNPPPSSNSRQQPATALPAGAPQLPAEAGAHLPPASRRMPHPSAGLHMQPPLALPFRDEDTSTSTLPPPLDLGAPPVSTVPPPQGATGSPFTAGRPRWSQGLESSMLAFKDDSSSSSSRVRLDTPMRPQAPPSLPSVLPFLPDTTLPQPPVQPQPNPQRQQQQQQERAGEQGSRGGAAGGVAGRPSTLPPGAWAPGTQLPLLRRAQQLRERRGYLRVSA